MENIAIFGSSRSGKSTLSKMISKKYPHYHIIIGDDIEWAFQQTLPSYKINNNGGSGMEEDFPNFLSCLFYQSIKSNDGIFNYIIETCDITPKKAQELFNKKNTIILFLGISQLTVEQHFSEIRKYETERDWTYKRSDDQLMEHCKYWLSKSKEYENECKRLNIWYVDTSFNREEVLNSTLEKIENMILANEGEKGYE